MTIVLLEQGADVNAMGVTGFQSDGADEGSEECGQGRRAMKSAAGGRGGSERGGGSRQGSARRVGVAPHTANRSSCIERRVDVCAHSDLRWD